MTAPLPFALDDEVALPGGEVIRGARARVYDLLRKTQLNAHRHGIGEDLGPPGWVPDFMLIRPEVGGSEGKKRARELRPRGVSVEVVRFKDSNTHLYAIAGTPVPAPAPTAAATKASPSELRFWTSTAPRPVGPNPICVSHRSPANLDRHWLAPLVGADERMHLASLREAWTEGLVEELLRKTRNEVTFWAHPAESPDSYDPLPAITFVLRRAGTQLKLPVTYLGTWQWRERE